MTKNPSPDFFRQAKPSGAWARAGDPRTISRLPHRGFRGPPRSRVGSVAKTSGTARRSAKKKGQLCPDLPPNVGPGNLGPGPGSRDDPHTRGGTGSTGPPKKTFHRFSEGRSFRGGRFFFKKRVGGATPTPDGCRLARPGNMQSSPRPRTASCPRLQFDYPLHVLRLK